MNSGKGGMILTIGDVTKYVNYQWSTNNGISSVQISPFNYFSTSPYVRISGTFPLTPPFDIWTQVWTDGGFLWGHLDTQGAFTLEDTSLGDSGNLVSEPSVVTDMKTRNVGVTWFTWLLIN